MARVKKILIIVASVVLLAVLAATQLIPLQPKEIPNTAGATIQQPISRVSQFFKSSEPARIQQELQMDLQTTPATWFGLVISLAGTLLFWMSVMWVSKRMRN